MGAEKHEIYAVSFGGHLFYDLFLHGQEGMAGSAPLLDPTILFIYLGPFGSAGSTSITKNTFTSFGTVKLSRLDKINLKQN